MVPAFKSPLTRGEPTGVPKMAPRMLPVVSKTRVVMPGTSPGVGVALLERDTVEEGLTEVVGVKLIVGDTEAVPVGEGVALALVPEEAVPVGVGVGVAETVGEGDLDARGMPRRVKGTA